MGKIIDIIPNTQEWHDYRATRLGASQSSIILNINPWQSIHDLYEEKLFGKKVQLNSSMQRGLNLEYLGTQWAQVHFNTIFCPRIIEHDDYPWKFATLDAIDPTGQIIVEIKFANRKVHEMAKEGKVIDYYFSQVQSQIACCGLEYGYFLSCYQESNGHIDYVLVKVDKDESYIDNMIFAESVFYQKCMIEKIAPELTDRDFEHVKDNLEFDYHCEAYLDINQRISLLEKEKKMHQERILILSKDRNSRSDSFKASKFKVKGSVDTKVLYEFYKISDSMLDAFRKESREQWRITKK